MPHLDKHHAGRDDDGILEMTRQHASSNATAARLTTNRHENLADARRRIKDERARVAREREEVREEIAQRQRLDKELEKVEQRLRQEEAELDRAQGAEFERMVVRGNGGGIDYASTRFRWYGEVRATMEKVFGISAFRLCQEGVVNACMDGRDVVCVMPTGGGKSLTYQLPALLTDGSTIVISPLISLMTDQTIHLQEAGVNCMMLSGTTSNGELRRLSDSSNDEEIKLCYVTPEKIAKSKKFKQTLQRMYDFGRLGRFVVDEAHCISQMGHDYRPDYKSLRDLRQLFPNVPILAVSATCPPAVLKDLTKTLNLKKVTDGLSANADGTVYFSSPLYRRNLHYQVLPKPTTSDGVMEAMKDYILSHHRGKSGIIYCLSKKEAAEVAEGLENRSQGVIKTGVYHAEIEEEDKRSLHVCWRQGKINIVCATIAFGLGIDKGDVRFVLHHSMPKSLDGFYQESGRAGRDGEDAACILFYRPQDASRLSSMVYHTADGKNKLYAMLRFCQNMHECRKVAFAKYFSATSDIEISSWTTADAEAMTPCGHCDNCQRPPETVEERDVTLAAWQILKVAEHVAQEGGRQTIHQLGDLVRGLGGASFQAGVVGKTKRGRKSNAGGEKVKLDLQELIGGKVIFGKEDTERLLIELLLQKLLVEEHVATAYSVNTYLTTSDLALRYCRLTRAQVDEGQAPTVKCAFPAKAKKQAAARRKSTVQATPTVKKFGSAGESSSHSAQSRLKFGEGEASSSLRPTRKNAGKAKAGPATGHLDVDDEGVPPYPDFDFAFGSEGEAEYSGHVDADEGTISDEPAPPSKTTGKRTRMVMEVVDSSDNEDWITSVSARASASRRPTKKPHASAPSKPVEAPDGDDSEVVLLDSDV